MLESVLRKVTCSVTSLIFLVVVLSCSRLMSECQGQETMRSLKSLTKNKGYSRYVVHTAMTAVYRILLKTPSSLAEIYKHSGRNSLHLSSTLKMLVIFYQNTWPQIFKQVNKQSKYTS